MAQVKPIPPGLHTVTPSLVLRDCAKAIEFYKNAFGAQEVMRMPTPDGKGIWHAEIKIGDSIVYLTDEMPGSTVRAPSPENPSSVYIQLYVENADSVYQRAVKAGAKPSMPIADMFWGDRMGMVLDPFGQGWSIGTHVKDLSDEEIRRAGEEFARRMAQQQKQPAPQHRT